MTAALRINGITMPVADGSADTSIDEIGDSPRAVNAQQLIARRAVKQVLAGETVLDSPANALAYRDLILGQKTQAWQLTTHLYSYKGLPITSSGSFTTNTVTGTWAKTTCLSWPNGTLVTATDGYDYTTKPWTVSFWAYLGSSWNHYVETSANQKFVDGTLAGARTFSATGTTALSLLSAGTWYIDDLQISQYLWPSTWPALVRAYATPTGPASRINCDGLLIENNAGTRVCRGVVESLPVRQAFVGGVWTANAQSVRFKLVEV